jgi:hypothetical protein
MKQKGSVGRLVTGSDIEEPNLCNISGADVDEFEKCPFYNFTGECTEDGRLCRYDPSNK